MLDHLSECLARHMNAGIDRMPRSFPGAGTATQDRDILVTDLPHSLGGFFGEPFAVIAPDDPGASARHQIVNHHFDPPKR